MRAIFSAASAASVTRCKATRSPGNWMGRAVLESLRGGCSTNDFVEVHAAQEGSPPVETTS